MKTLNQITKKIESLKSSLIKKAQKKGLYENFGMREQNILSEFIGYIWEYSPDQRVKILKLENNFCAWCYDYT
jgi:hypothetical protein